MATSSPHHDPHKTAGTVQTVSGVLFWIVFILSLATGIFSDWNEYVVIKQTVDLINIISILVFFALEVITEYVLVPGAEQKRRDDFIDNSFGTKSLISNSVNYYDNEEIRQGLYKAAVNLFENIFYTSFLVKTLTVRKIVLPAIALSSVWVFAFYGFNNVPIALTVLQVFFSTQILGDLIKHLILRSQLDHLQNSMIALFKHSDFREKIYDHQTDLYRSWLRYEALLSRIQPGVPDGVFNQHNDKLLVEWKNLKTKFSIG